MRKRFLSILVAMGLLVPGLLAQTAFADSHGQFLGVQWQWAELTETQPASQSVVPDPENYFLVLNEDGAASLKADCNMVQWAYTLEDSVLTFNTVGPSTLAFCGEESLDQLFLGKLGLGGIVSIEDDRMVLDLNENGGRMVFDNGGPAETAEDAAPETMPETGGAWVLGPWAAAVAAGLATLGAGAALRRRKR